MRPGLATDWWAAYLGIEYAEGGRQRSAGLDCWGLVRLVLEERCGIALPLYGAVSAGHVMAVVAALDAAADAPESPWMPVQHGFEQPFDVARIRRPAKVEGRHAKLAWHVGIVTRPGHLLHMDRPTGVIELAFRDGPCFSHHYSMPPRDVSLYRHRELAPA